MSSFMPTVARLLPGDEVTEIGGRRFDTPVRVIAMPRPHGRLIEILVQDQNGRRFTVPAVTSSAAVGLCPPF